MVLVEVFGLDERLGLIGLGTFTNSNRNGVAGASAVVRCAVIAKSVAERHGRQDLGALDRYGLRQDPARSISR